MGRSNQDSETRVILHSNTNLTAWAFQIKNTVCGKGGVEMLLGTKLHPATAGAIRNGWDKKAGQIISLISNNNNNDPQAMWKCLHEMNSVSGLDCSSALWECFFFTRLDMEETNAMSTHIARLRGLRAELDARKETVAKTLFIVTLLRSLPQDDDSWDFFRQPVCSDIQNNNPEHIIKLCLSEFASETRTDPLEQNPGAGAPNALVAHSRMGASHKPGTWSHATRTVECYNYSGRGHFKSERPSPE